MEDLFKKIPSLVKPPSKKSSPSSSRSTTPSPPPATLPPPLPTPDIPIQLPVGPLLPPPPITAVTYLGAPISSTSPPLPSLTQTAVFRRDRATRVFEHSPLGNQLSLANAASQYQQQKEQIEKQRGRYRFRGGPTDTQKSASRSSSPGGKTSEKAGKGKNNGTLVPQLSPIIIPTAGEFVLKPSRSGPATTFEEILSIDGAPGANCASPDFAVCVSGSSATAFGTGFTTRRMRKDPVNRIMKAYSDSVEPNWTEDGYPATEISQYRVDSSAPSISTATGFGEINNNWSEIEHLSKWDEQIGASTENKTPGDDQQEIRRNWFGLKYTDLELHMDSQYENRPSLAPPPPPTYDISDSNSEYRASMIAPENGSHTLQADGPASTPAELPERPDPFGLRAIIPTEDAIRIAEEGHPISFFQRFKDFFTSNTRNIRARAMHALTTGPDMNNNTDIDTDSEEPCETEEDIGTRKAKAVARVWSRTNLVTCYSCIVILTSYFGLGSVYSVFIIKEALNYWATKGEIKVYQFELALSMLTVTRVLGIMLFAKLTNAYSRPCALFVAVIFTIGGIGLSAFAVTWESFCAGHALFHFGRSGALVVAQVIVADTSDLSWRGCFTWGLEAGSVLWIWATPVVEKLITGTLGWCERIPFQPIVCVAYLILAGLFSRHVPIWIFFSFAFPATIPPLVATYLFHRRAFRWGRFPARKNVHRRVWWSLGGFSNRLKLFSIEYDYLGVLLWTMGVGLLTTALSLSEKMQAGIGVWMAVLLVGGSLTIVALVAWEVWLNNGLKSTRRLARQESLYHKHPARLINHCTHTGSSISAVLDEHTTIHEPTGYDSALVAQISARIMASQDPRKVARWRGHNSTRGRSRPLFRTRLLRRRTVPVGCLIGFLANFSTRIGSWTVWERAEHLPLDYRQLVEFVQGGEILTNVGFTSIIMGGFFVSLMMQTTKLFKCFVVSGLLLMMGGLLTFHSAEICTIGQRRLIFAQTFIGIGAGMACIALMVGVQASCKRHSDVAISIGLLTTFNAIGGVTAKAMKGLMQTYLFILLPAGSSEENFVNALNRHWSVMLLIAVGASAFAIVMAGIGLSGHNLDEVKQHVSGIVFGTDDTERRNSGEEHTSWATPPPFIPRPRDAKIQPSESAPEQLGTAEEGTRVAGRNNASSRSSVGRCLKGLPSGSSETTSFAESRARDSSKSDMITRNRKSSQGCESTADWETSTSESIASESRTTSGSRTVTSSIQLARSYMDGVFAMEMDMERTPRAEAFRIFGPYGDASKDPASSLIANTPMGNEQNTIKRDHYKNRSTGGPTVIAESSVMGGEQGFSFKKRKIGVIIGGQATSGKIREGKPVWNDASSINSESASIGGFSSIFDEDPGEMTHPVPISSSFVSVLEQQVVDKQLDPTPQSNSFPFGSPNGSNLRIGQVLSEVSPDELVFTSNGAEELTIPGGQNSVTDGRVSRFSYRDEELALMRIPMLTSTSQLSVGDITPKVNALTKKDGCSPGQCLSPITKLSSQESLGDAAPTILEGSLESGVPSSKRASILPLTNRRWAQDRPKERETMSMGERLRQLLSPQPRGRHGGGLQKK